MRAATVSTAFNSKDTVSSYVGTEMVLLEPHFTVWMALFFFENEFNAAALRSKLRPATLCLVQIPSRNAARLGMYVVGVA